MQREKYALVNAVLPFSEPVKFSSIRTLRMSYYATFLNAVQK